MTSREQESPVYVPTTTDRLRMMVCDSKKYIYDYIVRREYINAKRRMLDGQIRTFSGGHFYALRELRRNSLAGHYPRAGGAHKTAINIGLPSVRICAIVWLCGLPEQTTTTGTKIIQQNKIIDDG